MNARKGKTHQYGVQVFDKDKEPKIAELHELLKSGNYKTSRYTIFEITDPKVRQISCLPYWPDRIVHHAIMMPLESIFVSTFNKNTYSCIKGKGIHAAVKDVSHAMLDRHGTKYCLKLDIKKFYPSIDHKILKQLLRKKLKDPDLLKLLDEIIDSADGVPIGNYLSQYFANFYLTYFDHWLKEVMHVKYYFRYADDMVIFSDNKAYLHQLLADIRLYLNIELKLTVKENYQVFLIAENNKKPVIGRGLDFLGYVFFRDHIRLRKSIKQKYFRMLLKNPNFKSIAAYNGWMIHGNCINLTNKKYDKKVFRYQHRYKVRRIDRKKEANGRHYRRENTGTQMQHS